jgi:hypothetical protein
VERFTVVIMLTETDLQRLEENLQRFGCIFERDARRLIEAIRKDMGENTASNSAETVIK